MWLQAHAAAVTSCVCLPSLVKAKCKGKDAEFRGCDRVLTVGADGHMKVWRIGQARIDMALHVWRGERLG